MMASSLAKARNASAACRRVPSCFACDTTYASTPT
jgi:hypothetical protein